MKLTCCTHAQIYAHAYTCSTYTQRDIHIYILDMLYIHTHALIYYYTRTKRCTHHMHSQPPTPDVHTTHKIYIPHTHCVKTCSRGHTCEIQWYKTTLANRLYTDVGFSKSFLGKMLTHEKMPTQSKVGAHTCTTCRSNVLFLGSLLGFRVQRWEKHLISCEHDRNTQVLGQWTPPSDGTQYNS